MERANTFSDNAKKVCLSRGNSRHVRYSNFKHYFTDYCNCTSVHGVKYIGEAGRFLVERVVWTLLVTIIGYLCLNLICKAYDKWVTSPVIVTFATTETPIFNIPFPAITICPEVKSDPEIFNYTDVLLKKLSNKNTTETEDRYFESFSLICDGFGRILAADLPDVRNKTIDYYSILDYITAVPEIDSANVSSLYWLQKEYVAEEMLSATFTSEGFCYSFNMVDYVEILRYTKDFISDGSLKNTKAREWSLEEGYPRDQDIDAFPRRTFLSGINGGFTFDIPTNDSHLDYVCGESLQGFKVTLHHPLELPYMDKHFRVPLDQAVYVGIKPRMITVSEGLKPYGPDIRKCYFSHERRLKYFKTYTQNNCLHECFSNFTLKECGCLAFYMPRFNDSIICGPGSLECLQRSRVNFLVNDTDQTNAEESCLCLPSCTSLEYDVEISQTDWNWRGIFEIFNRLGLKPKHFDYKNIHVSRLSVFYKEMQFLTSQRNELYGYVDFFSNTGGLLGLFTGFSVTSAFEILYFLTLRLVCNIKKYGWKYWSGQTISCDSHKDAIHMN